MTANTATSDSSSKPTGWEKVDPVTALQDGIDGLSLAMFEALRTLRDAVAPDSGNLGGNSSQRDSQADMEDLWHSYKNGDPAVVEQIHSMNGGVPIQKREDFIKTHAKMQMNKDTELVQQLANVVLRKSADINERVEALPGMNRSKADQLQYIQVLLGKNKAAIEDLEAAYKTASQRRNDCRDYICSNACESLTVQEELVEP